MSGWLAPILMSGAVIGEARASCRKAATRYLRYREPDTRIASIMFADITELVTDAVYADGPTPAHDYIWMLPTTVAADRPQN